MARPRQPIELLKYKGKKNLTKQEIEERENQEIKAPADRVSPPDYLPENLHEKFNDISRELMRIGIMSNLDVDALARFIISQKMYQDLSNELLDIKPMSKTEEGYEANPLYSDLLINLDKLFKQCRQAASDLGLTISSRCKLVVPKKDDKKEPSPEEQRFGDV